ncbi:bifunctional aminoglycoside phosphotransferase/ATP-binding protein [Candidatus Accumulibacter sp. ACC003]|uniref:bifunctional aminoglycoside phosphotransferase/ATP-binding protein n=1 Tax=Candidatus Accumulibacter sp. ACC003 TaxID=2823334 RepID=UPI0025B88141|nr:bifunctional aminoglycoside phosphotransferase/ATP-binding protein [Candidatus Accumulibacter sp. ACC003]
MSSIRPALIEALLDPARYPDPATRVDLVETHASWLLLAGSFAYKIKKALLLPFLDYRTLAQRQSCCEAELRLNRRFSPDLYLAVVRITGSPADPHIDGAGATIEFAVRMRRFAERGRLDHLCKRGQLKVRQVSALATAVADFHQQAATAPATTRFGEPAQVLAPALANFTELASLLGSDDEPLRLAQLAAWTRNEFDRLAPRFTARKTAGRVRECHGDLHLGNLVLIDERVRLFDCIEFSEDLRWIDVASEIAFTYIDLIDQGQPGLAGWLLDEWLACNGDYDALHVLRFYAVYRALVRAKVAAILAAQTTGDLSRARHYLALAEGLAKPPTPRLIITHGVAGCGKSRASRRLLLRDAAAATLRLRSDVERKRLFDLASAASSGSALDRGIYARDASERTYRRLHELAQEMLTAGWSVIVDASFLESSRRDDFRALATQLRAPFFIVAPQATPAVLRARVRGRLAKGRDASEATLAVLAQQLSRIEALRADERDRLL